MNSNQKIKIAHLLNVMGGAGKELGILKLIDHMDNDRFDSDVIAINGIFEKTAGSLNGYNIINLDIPPGNHPDLPFKLAKLFREKKYDIVHTHSWGTLLEGIIGAKIARVPVIIHGEHGTFPNKQPHNFIQRIFWGIADEMLSVSDVLGDKLSKATGFKKEKITSILNGVDEARFFPSSKLRSDFRKQFGYTEDDFIVGTAARINPVKNQPMIIKGMEPLIKNNELFEFALAGGGEMEEEMGKKLRELAISLNVSNHVKMLGFQSAVNMIYNGFDVFTLTSISEGCSNVIQEAMFVGKPIVATAVGGNVELVEDGVTGFLVENNNHQQWTEAIRKLRNNPDLVKEMGDNARRIAIEKFSVSTMVNEYQNVYTTLLRKKTKNPIIQLMLNPN